MQEDGLLQEWKKAKEICYKIIQISKNANIYNKISEVPMPKQSKQQYISVYDTVYKLCITKEKEQTRVTMVYKDFKEILRNALTSMCQQLKNQKDVHKLKYLRKIWEAYSDILKRLMHMFAFLNRPFHIKQGRIQQLQKTGITIIVTTLLGQDAIVQYETIYLKQIDRIRKTMDFSNAQILKDMVDILYKIHLKLVKNVNKKVITRYTQFYAKYLRNARDYYTKQHNYLKELNPSQYFEEVNRIYGIQSKIGIQCFGIGGQILINKQFAECFIQKYRDTLMKSEKGLKNILRNRQISTLKIVIQMYTKLTKNIEGFKEQFEQYIFEDIRGYMQEMKNQLLIKRNVNSYCNFMQKIISKNKQYLMILQESFMHLGDFINYYKTGVQKAFTSVKLPINIEQILALYADNKFKLGTVQQNQVEGIMKNIMAIFMCIQNKDMFMMRYTQKLSKQLLQISPESIRNHQIFIQNLKLNCGIKFTERVETLLYQYGMISQYEPIIKKIVQERGILMDFNVKIFSQGAWPATNFVDIPIHYFPETILAAQQCLKVYRQEFNSKKSFKISYLQSKLRWIYYFDPQVQNKTPECYFQTNCLQGAILYYIYRNRPDIVGLKFLETYFQKIPLKLLKENINKMIDIADNILNRINQNGEVFYEFNSKMKSQKRLITYQTGASNQQERLFQQQDLGKDRQIVLDANIAKFMKSKKITDFETLFGQITKMIKTFNPQKRDIKIAIDRLITKQLLQRDQKDLNKIKYID